MLTGVDFISTRERGPNKYQCACMQVKCIPLNLVKYVLKNCKRVETSALKICRLYVYTHALDHN